MRFGNITSFKGLPRKEYEFPDHHFEFISYNQLPSRVPYLDEEDSKMIYPILTDYLGRIRSISDITPFRDATTGQKYQRKVNIGSFDGNVVEFTMWDDLANQFNKQEIEKLPPRLSLLLAPIAYQNTEVSATLATHYYINPHNLEAENAYTMFKEKYNLNLPLQVTKYQCDDPEQEKTRNRQTLYNFKAIVADGMATAEFTFFTDTGQNIIGHPCSHLMQNFEATDKTQLPIEMVNTIVQKHIFQIQFTPVHSKCCPRHQPSR
ncbi:DNA helicase [Tanacetum coccineum]